MWRILSFFTLIAQNLFALACWEMTPQAVRDKINQSIMEIKAPALTVWSITDQTIHCLDRDTPIRIYKPCQDENLPVILLIHGGAWVAGNLDTHDNLARYLCFKTSAVVVSVGYLNSPEGKFPLPLEQCYDALNWIAEELSVDMTKLAIVGDSAGGNMAAALCLMIRDREGPKPSLQVLINPAIDLTCNGTLERCKDKLDIMRWQAVQYVSNPNDARHPYVSPLIAEALTDLPPAVVILAENDDLREDGQRYADQLHAANVPTRVYCQKNIGHLGGHGARASLLAQESLDVAAKALQEAFNYTENDSKIGF